VREKYYFGWKFTIVYDKPQPNEQAVSYRPCGQAFRGHKLSSWKSTVHLFVVREKYYTIADKFK